MTTVYVKAYTRADGTQVSAYTREIEGASNKDISLSMQDLSKDIERSFEDFSLFHQKRH